MILVDIYVPSVDQEYDFHLDQNAPIELVIEELVELISQKERCKLTGSASEMMLCNRVKESILPANYTLAQCGISSGSKLILV